MVGENTEEGAKVRSSGEGVANRSGTKADTLSFF